MLEIKEARKHRSTYVLKVCVDLEIKIFLMIKGTEFKAESTHKVGNLTGDPLGILDLWATPSRLIETRRELILA